MQIIWNDIKHQTLSRAGDEIARHLDISITSSAPLSCRSSCHLSLQGAFFTDSREHECHNALKSLISLPSCHLAPPRALSLCSTCRFCCLLGCLSLCVPVRRSVETLFSASHHKPLSHSASADRHTYTHIHTHTLIKSLC